ncbi:hypothetical protein [Delftia phage PhiW-14]|uniref:Uncharacterized protein n=1 Tax=Delftia phage PhiW-14 TaxID=665032 RepID=C9DGD6_BPW14|nr:hypothetical protein DP-phiW-14_gp166 [Delftia phage PhiW-14]ACV50187.1 hypothetical protein [Delftia phage PhiW-14]
MDNNPHMDALIQQFAQEYRHWVVAGCPDHPCFKKEDGLCYAVSAWYNRKSPDNPWGDLKLSFYMQDHLFAKGEKLVKYPFGGVELYIHEYKKQRMPYNPLRMAWIEAKADGVLGVPPISWSTRWKHLIYIIKNRLAIGF